MSEQSPRTPLSRIILRGVLLVVILAVAVIGWRWLKSTELLPDTLKRIQDLGPWAPVAFIATYIVAVLLFVPASIFTLGAGFVFGMAWGSVYVLVAAMLAANLMFVIGRHVARKWVAHWIESHPKFRAIDNAVAREGWKIVALIRLAPVFPFTPMSYAFGLTRVPLWEYFLANFMMIPSTLMYVYFGAVARDLTEKVATPPWIKWTVGAVTVLVVLYVTRFAKRALTQKIS